MSDTWAAGAAIGYANCFSQDSDYVIYGEVPMGLRPTDDNEKKKRGHSARSAASPLNRHFSVSPLFSLPSKPGFSMECIRMDGRITPNCIGRSFVACSR
jgi:hypothetical protein